VLLLVLPLVLEVLEVPSLELELLLVLFVSVTVASVLLLSSGGIVVGGMVVGGIVGSGAVVSSLLGGHRPPNPQHAPGAGAWQLPSGQVTRPAWHSCRPVLPEPSVSAGVMPS